MLNNITVHLAIVPCNKLRQRIIGPACIACAAEGERKSSLCIDAQIIAVHEFLLLNTFQLASNFTIEKHLCVIQPQS